MEHVQFQVKQTKTFLFSSIFVSFFLKDFIWYSSENNPHLLLVIYSPNIVTLWNCQTGTKIWRVVYENDRQRDVDSFLQIIQDPFQYQRAICSYFRVKIFSIETLFFFLVRLGLGQSGLTLIEDLSPSNTPSGQARRYYISNSGNSTTKSTVNSLMNTHKRSSSNSSISSTSSQLTTRLKTIIEGTDLSK